MNLNTFVPQIENLPLFLSKLKYDSNMSGGDFKTDSHSENKNKKIFRKNRQLLISRYKTTYPEGSHQLQQHASVMYLQVIKFQIKQSKQQ